MNPSKHDDPQAFKDLINRKAKELGIDHVHWRETTREDPGTGQAVHALEEGASSPPVETGPCERSRPAWPGRACAWASSP